ncbi:MAG: hypothetical protein WBN50_11870 [Lutimonas sp.]
MADKKTKSDYKTILVDRHEMANAVNTDMGLELLDVRIDLCA